MEIIHNLSQVYLECIPDPILILDIKGTTQYANQPFSKLTGIPMEELVGRPLDVLRIGDKYKNLYWENYQRMGPGDFVREHFMQKNQDGGFSHFDVRLIAVECPIEHGRVICFFSIVNDITDVIDKTKQMTFIESELQKAADTLKQLLYKSSHDLRAPIATIGGIISLAKLTAPSPEMSSYLDMISESSKKMDTVLSDLRKVYTMYLGHFESEEIDFYKLVHSLLAKYQTNDVEVKLNVYLTRTHFHCKYLLEKIFVHLLDNAFRYRLPGGKGKHRVKIHIEDSDDALQIIISDNGRGIKKDIQDKIFEMFFKGEYGARKNGMGLFIVKTAVDKLYGKIHVDSEEGQGTVITVVLP